MRTFAQVSFAATAFVFFANCALAQTQAPPISFVQASNVACKVGRPNVKSGETVTWQGQCAGGLAQGVGTAQWLLGGKPTLRFEGTYVRGLLEGKGKMIGADGDRYDGEYKGGLRHGHGVYVAANGARFEGEYRDNQRVGTSVAAPATAQPQAAQGPTPSVSAPSASQVSTPPPSAPSGETRLVACHWVAMATNQATGLPNVDSVSVSDPRIGAVWAQVDKQLGADTEAARKSYAFRLANEATAFATKNKGNCPPSNSLVTLILLVFKDRLPEKIPTINSHESATSIPGLLVYAEEKDGKRLGHLPEWRFYNIGYRRELVEKAQKGEQARKAIFMAFAERNKVVEFVAYDKLKANPFNYEGKSIVTILLFMQMRTSSSGIFEQPRAQPGSPMFVTDLPKTLFSKQESAVMAVKVIGTTTLDEPSGKRTVPHLKYLDAIKCQREDCRDVFEGG